MNVPDKLGDLPLPALDSLRSETPAQDRIAGIALRLEQTLEPVRPLPSRRTAALSAFALFLAFAALAALPFGYNGLRTFSALQRAVDYGLLAGLAVLFSIAFDQEIVPGSKFRIGPVALVVFSFIAIVLETLLLFPHLTMSNFVARGVPCLRLGLASAALSGLLAWYFTRRGYSPSPARSGAIAGSFAGLAGFAVLALHCSVQNASHILLWHLTAYVLGAIAGSLIGLLPRARNPAS